VYVVDTGVCYGGRNGYFVWRDRMWVLMEKWGENVEGERGENTEGEKGGVWGCIWNER